ncbi:MAG: hypothetical protein VYB06_06690, partial [Cyanobacteriota bacterium]|nr:hypothetical protein [Cyanobacteriota bacterium]
GYDAITGTSSIDGLIPSNTADHIVHFNANPISNNAEALAVLQQVVATHQDSSSGITTTDGGNSVYQPSSSALSFDEIYSTSSAEASDADSGDFVAINEAVSSDLVESVA